MSKPSKWIWTGSNGNATDAQTKAACQALMNNGATANFSYLVWDDIIDKISEQREAWQDWAWNSDLSGLSMNNTKLLNSGVRMTATRFNSAVKNMPPLHDWPWEQTLNRSDIKTGDTCYGIYFIYLTDGLNHWIDLTPLPFTVDISPVLTANTNTLVRRALHVASNQKIIFSPTANIVVRRLIVTKASLLFNSDFQLNPSLLRYLPTGILLLGNTKFRNKISLDNSSHILINNDVQLNIVGRVSCGDMAFIVCEVGGQSDFKGVLNIPGSVPTRIDSASEFTSTGKVIVSRLFSLAALISGQFSGEAWVREPDSLAIKNNLEIIQSGSLKLTFSDMQRVIVNLAIQLSPTADISLSTIQNIIFALNYELEHKAKITNSRFIKTKAELIANHAMQVMMYRKKYKHLGGNLTMDFATAATAVFASRELYTGVNLPYQLDMTARSELTNNKLPTGSDLTYLYDATLKAELTNNKLPTGASLSDTIDLSAKAAVNPNIMATHARMYDYLVGPITKVTAVPRYKVQRFSANLTDTTDMSATISTFDNRIYARGGINATHTGEGRVELLNAAELRGVISAEFSGAVTFDAKSAAQIRVNMQFENTCSATITTKRYILASEIDDELVSDLDNILVYDVEFH